MHTDTDTLLEVVDAANRPLAVMEVEQIHRQGLMHRGVYVLLRIKGDRLVLRKRPKDAPIYPGRWDITGRGHVRAGEASLDTVERVLPKALRDADLRLVRLCGLAAGAATGFEFVEVYHARLAPQLAKILEDDLTYMSVDRDELEALTSTYPDQLTPTLMMVWNTAIAFKSS